MAITINDMALEESQPAYPARIKKIADMKDAIVWLILRIAVVEMILRLRNQSVIAETDKAERAQNSHGRPLTTPF